MSDPGVKNGANNGPSERRRRPIHTIGRTLEGSGNDLNVWKRRVPYSRGDGVEKSSTSAGRGKPSAISTSNSSDGRLSSRRPLLPSQPLQVDGTVEDAANALISNQRLPSTQKTLDGGFSGRLATIQRPFSSRQEASAVPRQASESGLGAKNTSPTTKLGRHLEAVIQIGRKLLVGSHKGDLTTLPLSIVASRVMYLAVLLMALNMPEIYDRLNQPPKWSYSPGRSLKGRDCIMSLYIEKLKVRNLLFSCEKRG
jgi:hypothetical protein